MQLKPIILVIGIFQAIFQKTKIMKYFTFIPVTSIIVTIIKLKNKFH